MNKNVIIYPIIVDINNKQRNALINSVMRLFPNVKTSYNDYINKFSEKQIIGKARVCKFAKNNDEILCAMLFINGENSTEETPNSILQNVIVSCKEVYSEVVTHEPLIADCNEVIDSICHDLIGTKETYTNKEFTVNKIGFLNYADFGGVYDRTIVNIKLSDDFKNEYKSGNINKLVKLNQQLYKIFENNPLVELYTYVLGDHIGVRYSINQLTNRMVKNIYTHNIGIVEIPMFDNLKIDVKGALSVLLGVQNITCDKAEQNFVPSFYNGDNHETPWYNQDDINKMYANPNDEHRVTYTSVTDHAHLVLVPVFVNGENVIKNRNIHYYRLCRDLENMVLYGSSYIDEFGETVETSKIKGITLAVPDGVNLHYQNDEFIKTSETMFHLVNTRLAENKVKLAYTDYTEEVYDKLAELADNKKLYTFKPKDDVEQFMFDNMSVEIKIEFEDICKDIIYRLNTFDLSEDVFYDTLRYNIGFGKRGTEIILNHFKYDEFEYMYDHYKKYIYSLYENLRPIKILVGKEFADDDNESIWDEEYFDESLFLSKSEENEEDEEDEEDVTAYDFSIEREAISRINISRYIDKLMEAQPTPGYVNVVIAGSRTFKDYKLAEKEIHNYLIKIKKHIELVGKPFNIISGCAKGADTLGETYAFLHNMHVTKMPAAFDIIGKDIAGDVRNKAMALRADYILAFWDGESTGTRNMINYARQMHIPCRVVYYKGKKSRELIECKDIGKITDTIISDEYLKPINYVAPVKFVDVNSYISKTLQLTYKYQYVNKHVCTIKETFLRYLNLYFNLDESFIGSECIFASTEKDKEPVAFLVIDKFNLIKDIVVRDGYNFVIPELLEKYNELYGSFYRF